MFGCLCFFNGFWRFGPRQLNSTTPSRVTAPRTSTNNTEKTKNSQQLMGVYVFSPWSTILKIAMICFRYQMLILFFVVADRPVKVDLGMGGATIYIIYIQQVGDLRCGLPEFVA